MAKVLVISQDLVRKLVTLEETFDIVEQAFLQFYRDKSVVFPAVRERIEQHHGIFGIKSSYLIDDKCIGLKAGGFWQENIKRDTTNHQSTMLLFDAETGEPKCLLDANYLTGVRTGAAGAVAAKYFARSDSKVIAIIGAGVQSRMQVEYLLDLFPIQEVRVYSTSFESSQRFADEFYDRGFTITVTDNPKQAVESADIVVTTTPSFTPVIQTSWLKEGVHVNAMGSDTKGKHEIEMDKTPDKIVCDLWEQVSIMGELQHGFSKEAVHAEIGAVISGDKPGRQKENEMTLFDSTGIAVQDLSVASFIYRKAKELGLGLSVDL